MPRVERREVERSLWPGPWCRQHRQAVAVQGRRGGRGGGARAAAPVPPRGGAGGRGARAAAGAVVPAGEPVVFQMALTNVTADVAMNLSR
jgi:hypothetical protein